MNDKILWQECQESILLLFALVNVKAKSAKSSVGAPEPLAEKPLTRCSKNSAPASTLSECCRKDIS